MGVIVSCQRKSQDRRPKSRQAPAGKRYRRNRCVSHDMGIHGQIVKKFRDFGPRARPLSSCRGRKFAGPCKRISKLIRDNLQYEPEK